MSKRPVTVLETTAAYSFYRPHERSATWFTNEIQDPVTGEIRQDPSMTKQSFVDQCDLNKIMKQFNPREQARIMAMQAQGGSYDDLPDEVDYQEAQNIRIRAETAFATLPSSVRKRFDNDPGEFLAFMADPANQDEAITLGLASKRATDAPIEPQAPNEASPPPGAPDGSKNAPAA